MILAIAITCAAEAEPTPGASQTPTEIGLAFASDAEGQEECLPNVSLLQNSFHLTRAPVDDVPGSAKKNQFYNLHIPKSAGSSWALDMQKIVSPGYSVVSQEGCYSLHEENPHLEGVTVMLRDPRSHVLSQFNMCHTHWVSAWRNESIFASGAHGKQVPGRFEDWVSAWRDLAARGWRGNFTPSAELLKQGEVRLLIREHRLKAWADPPYSAQPGTHLNVQDWPWLDGGGTIWHHAKMPYECYSPLDLQSRRLTCKRPLEYLEPVVVADAVENLNGSWFFGFAEEYQASVCMFHAKFAKHLPDYCDCTVHTLWKTFHAHKENTKERKFDSRKIAHLPKDLLMSIDELTVIDRYLYKFAWERFVSEARAVKERFGKTVLCDETLPLQRDFPAAHKREEAPPHERA